MESYHTKFHELINTNLECTIAAKGIIKDEQKDTIMKRFKEAEECFNSLLALMDNLTDELGSDINMSEVLAC